MPVEFHCDRCPAVTSAGLDSLVTHSRADHPGEPVRYHTSVTKQNPERLLYVSMCGRCGKRRESKGTPLNLFCDDCAAFIADRDAHKVPGQTP